MNLWDLGLRSIRELETEHGILASSRAEAYGCIFGRDSLITSLSLLTAFQRTQDPYFLLLVEKVLRNLAHLQGREINLESGEEPGKCIHEWRPSGHEHLTRAPQAPWYVYPDNVLRNYDTVDATPLYLMTAHEYGRLSETGLPQELMPSVRAALSWLLDYGDSNGDGLIDYRFHPDRTYGGLRTQSWMDSTESLFFEHEEEEPVYPIAPVEAQAYAYVALRAWSDYFEASDPAFSKLLAERSATLRLRFNQDFPRRRSGAWTLAFAIDGLGRPLVSPRSSMGHCLWAARRRGGAIEGILNEEYVPDVVRRLMARDLFVPRAGIRTLSSRSRHFNPLSYHNGSIWPHDGAMLAEGLENFGYVADALRVRGALKSAYAHFKTPIELFGYSKGRFKEYAHHGGAGACRVQAWSAAALLSMGGE